MIILSFHFLSTLKADNVRDLIVAVILTTEIINHNHTATNCIILFNCKGS
jgi:hypothetical protein